MSNVLKDGYRKVKLKEVCDEITVGYVGPMAKEYVDDGILFLRSQNIREFHLDLTDVKYISEAFHKRIKKSALSPGDIVVIRTGYPGITCVIPKELKVLNCADLVIFRPSKGLNPLYLALVFNSNWGKKHIAGRLVGVAQQHFNVTVAKEVIIELPPRSIQDKIAAIMGNYDDLIENNLRRIKILEEMARLIYREWFVHFRFPGHEGVRMVDSPMGMIPEGWVIRKLADITLLNEISIRKDSAPEEIFYIDISSVSPGRIDKIEKMKFADASSRARRVVNHGDIIWSCVRPNRKSYSLIINPIKNLIVSTGFAVVTARELPFTFLYGALTTEDFVAYLTNNTTGAAYPAVTSEVFQKADILVPSDNIVEIFNELVEPICLLKYNLSEKNVRLKDTRDLLLPKLISGDLDVSEMDIRVPEDEASAEELSESTVGATI